MNRPQIEAEAERIQEVINNHPSIVQASKECKPVRLNEISKEDLDSIKKRLKRIARLRKQWITNK